MALLETPKADTALIAPDFHLKNIDGSMVRLNDVKGENGTVIMFICNHCPYVIAIADRLEPAAQKLEALGIGLAAIMSNDTDNHPADSFENMQKFAALHNFSFPYLIDETQDIAKAYGAVCTPDFFGFNKHGELCYRGRLDSAGKDPANDDTTPELIRAMKQVAETGSAPEKQFPSMGCSIKWR